MLKRCLAPSITCVILLSSFSKSGYAYTYSVNLLPVSSSSEVAIRPVRIWRTVKHKIVGTRWLAHINRSNVKKWVNGGEEGFIYYSKQGSIIGPYTQLNKWVSRNLPGGGDPKYNKRNAHHILTTDHVNKFFPNHGLDIRYLPAVNLSRRNHMESYHKKLDYELKQIKRRHNNLDTDEARGELWSAYQRVYAEHPDWLDAIKIFFED